MSVSHPAGWPADGLRMRAVRRSVGSKCLSGTRDGPTLVYLLAFDLFSPLLPHSPL